MIIRYNIPKLKWMISDFYNVTGITISVLDTEQNPVCTLQDKAPRFCKRIQQYPDGAEACTHSDRSVLCQCAESRQPVVHLCPEPIKNGRKTTKVFLAIPMLIFAVRHGWRP